MIGELQSTAVSLLEGFRQRYAQADLPDGLLAPRAAVEPYAAQLLDFARTVSAVPVVWVELASGDLTPQSERTGTASGEHALSLVCAARNEAGRGATVHDGGRLMSWAVAALQHASWKIGPYQVGHVQYERMASTQQVWAGELVLTVSRGRHAAPVPPTLSLAA